MAVYSLVRNQIKSGDILVWTSRGWGNLANITAQAIRLMTRSEYCHVGVAWEIGGRMMVVEAVQPLVRIYPLSKLLPCYHLKMDIQWQSSFDEILMERVGDPYSVWQAIISYFGSPVNDEKWQCVELANYIYKRIGVPMAEVYTPTAFVEEALKHSNNGLFWLQ